MEKQIELGPTPKLNGKWKAVKPENSNGYWYVLDKDGSEICTTYNWYDGTTAKMIVKDHNEQLKNGVVKLDGRELAKVLKSDENIKRN